MFGICGHLFIKFYALDKEINESINYGCINMRQHCAVYLCPGRAGKIIFLFLFLSIFKGKMLISRSGF